VLALKWNFIAYEIGTLACISCMILLNICYDLPLGYMCEQKIFPKLKMAKN
jgi:hypothetical protein